MKQRRGGAYPSSPPDIGGLVNDIDAWRNSEVRFRAIADYTYDWETWFAPDGDPLWVNPAVERMTGYSVEECMAMPDYPLPLIDPLDRDIIGRLLREAREGSSGNDHTFRILRKDGSLCWAAVSWQPIRDDEGTPLGVRTSVRDITKRKSAEEAMRVAREKAERANLAKSKFLAAASHDLRQPLQAMGLFLSTLKFTATDDESRTVIENLDDCLMATNDLLNALLDVSRLDAGILQPSFSAVPVAVLIDELEVEYCGRAREKGIELRTVACSAAVRSDPTLLERILRNLVSNAVRHTDAGRVLVGCRRRRDAMEIQVWDTGKGIPEEAIDKVFEEFYQIGNPERDRRQGLGLGLSIVRRVADLLGHSIKVSSVLNKGTMFSVTVPRERAAVPSDQESVSHEGQLAGALIMVIDDDPVQLEAIHGLFTHWGCQTLVAKSAEEAGALLSASKEIPDLILSDYRLGGGLVGAEAIRHLQRQLGFKVPGVILTGDTEPSRLREARKSGFELVHKPIVADQLMAILAKTLAPVTVSGTAQGTPARPTPGS